MTGPCLTVVKDNKIFVSFVFKGLNRIETPTTMARAWPCEMDRKYGKYLGSFGSWAWNVCNIDGDTWEESELQEIRSALEKDGYKLPKPIELLLRMNMLHTSAANSVEKAVYFDLEKIK